MCSLNWDRATPYLYAMSYIDMHCYAATGKRFIGEENNIIVISANKVVNDDCEI